MAKTLHYTGITLDRAATRRRDEAWVDAHLNHAATRFIPLWQGRSLICMTETGDTVPEPVFLTGAAAQALIVEAGTTVILGVEHEGLENEIAYVAADISTLDEQAAGEISARADAGEFMDLRRVGAVMAGDMGALLAYARGMIHWHQRHRFCGVCGKPTQSRDGGYMRVCSDEDTPHTHFPRTDPAVIMLVAHANPEGQGPACLLGRQKKWVEGMYSTLAGFVDPGETLEEAVAREVEEESAIRVTDVRYQASQPWPFPSSLMLGFRARATTTEIDIDPREIEDARWFTPEELKNFGEWANGPAVNGEMRLPRRDSIARRLIDDWLEDVAGG
ncbi:MAG: NAD(+) diphosphatase [Alphaproteobacteria bacterium]|nr:NAD(+) diphosphatase [Alphaproteobacteria bacterium]